MSHSRLTLAVESGQLELPSEGKIAVFAPTAAADLSALPKDRSTLVQPFKPDFDALTAQGFDCQIEAAGSFSAAVVFLPRAKAQAQALIAQAADLADLVIVDGQKNGGVDSMLKECRKRADILGSFSKAHGKIFWFEGGAFDDWRRTGQTDIGGYVTAPGVFSADGIDPASAALVAALPDKLGRHVADLGAGWGFLSKAILERPEVETLYLVEADHTALECAKINVQDDRAEFHWADATQWEPRARMNAVVMNPPFHTGRTADPDLGRAFISAAARMLAPNGSLWLVANRHLPYEATLSTVFASVEEIAGDNRFKILRADRPSRARR